MNPVAEALTGWPAADAIGESAANVFRIFNETTGEAIQLIRAMWTESPARFKGAHYQIEGAYCEPRPSPVPKVMVGGHGEKYLLRVVAQPR